MSAIRDKFENLRARNERALVLFVTGGDPSLEQLPEILDALEEGGADLIEIGIPFSDPIADGPTIQASSQRALDRGVRPGDLLEVLSRTAGRVPRVAMGYANTWHRMGYPKAAQRMAEAGISGVIVSDLIPEESGEWVAAATAAGLDTIFLTAPTSTDERIRLACQASSGFVYAVSRTGVTGAGTTLPPEASALVARVIAMTELPICVGFGISTPAHVASVCSVADGAVVGSWLVDWIARHWDNGKGRDALVSAVRELKAATRVPAARD